MSKWISSVKVIAILVALSSIGCGGGGGTTSTTQGGGTPGTTNTVTLVGQVAVSSSDLALAKLRKDQIARAKTAPIRFATTADSVLPDANITLYKVFADGTEEVVSGATTTTDANGNYTLANVPVAQTGTGAATDFYYEVRATSGALEVIAATAPTSNTTVNLSPESKIAAMMLSDVAEVPGVSTASVLPTEGTIENLSEMVYDNLSSMQNFTPPSTATSADDKVIIAANAVSANDGNAEKLMRAYEAQKEELYLQQNKSTVSESTVAGYLDRVTKAACDFNANTKLPQVVSSALAEAFKDGTAFTLDEVVTAFNSNNLGQDATVNGAISNFSGILDSLNTALKNKTDIPDDALLALYANRDDLTSLSSGTTLEADQALAMVQAMLPSDQRCQGGVDYVGLVSDLVGDPTIATTASFADIEVYHVRGSCPQGSLKARVQLYLPPGVTANSVTIAASGMKDINNNTVLSVNLTATFPASGIWEYGNFNNNEYTCLTFNQTYTYTITADLNGADDLTTTITRTIVDLPEASISLIDMATYTVSTQFSTGQPDQPIKITSQRPMFKWLPAPGTPPPSLGAPAGTQVKYLYDITHFNRNTGGPENRDFVNCPGEQNNTRFYDKDYILSPIDCDVDKCNQALPDAQHVCRLHVQTVLVDEYDRTLAWSAGADMYFCIQGQTNCN